MSNAMIRSNTALIMELEINQEKTVLLHNTGASYGDISNNLMPYMIASNKDGEESTNKEMKLKELYQGKLSTQECIELAAQYNEEGNYLFQKEVMLLKLWLPTEEIEHELEEAIGLITDEVLRLGYIEDEIYDFIKSCQDKHEQELDCQLEMTEALMDHMERSRDMRSYL